MDYNTSGTKEYMAFQFHCKANGKAPLPDISFRERTIFLNLEREREIPSATSLSHQVLGIPSAAAPLVFKLGDLVFEFSAQNPASCPHLGSMA